MNPDQPREHVFQLRSWSHQQIARLRVGVGVWLLFLAAILYGAGVGGPGWLAVTLTARPALR